MLIVTIWLQNSELILLCLHLSHGLYVVSWWCPCDLHVWRWAESWVIIYKTQEWGQCCFPRKFQVFFLTAAAEIQAGESPHPSYISHINLMKIWFQVLFSQHDQGWLTGVGRALTPLIWLSWVLAAGREECNGTQSFESALVWDVDLSEG